MQQQLLQSISTKFTNNNLIKVTNTLKSGKTRLSPKGWFLMSKSLKLILQLPPQTLDILVIQKVKLYPNFFIGAKNQFCRDFDQSI